MPADPGPESSVTGNDERRAEIEAVVNAHRAYCHEQQMYWFRLCDEEYAVIFEAFDRVRDARGNDEAGQQGDCSQCGRVWPSSQFECPCGAAISYRNPARSLQGEGHERRAEIEVVAKALGRYDAPEHWDWREYEEPARMVVEALDRVRDARGGDEAPTPDDDVIVRWECPECGWSIPDENSAGEGQPCEAWLHDGEAGEHGPTRKVRYRRIRSPQGKDHEAGIEAMAERIFNAIFPDDSWYEDAFQEQWVRVANRAHAAYVSRAWAMQWLEAEEEGGR